jgi:hypothetical protein
MRKSGFVVSRLVSAIVVVCSAALAFTVQDGGEPSRSKAGFGYKFENPRFTIPIMEIDLDPDGKGELRFKRGESDEVIDLKIELLPATIARVRTLLDSTSFLTSAEGYQAKKDFSHLGWMTIRASDGNRERTVRFNYTTNEAMKELADLFRAIATQQIHVFDIETAQQYQPLDLPRQLDWLEADLRLGNIAEPDRVVTVLRELSGGDTLPLIARNQAKRIITAIEKGKYKPLTRR